MFVDASVIVAIVSQEPGWDQLIRKLASPRTMLASPVSIWEATIALARSGGSLSFEAAEDEVEAFINRFSVQVIPITPEIGTLAVEASRRYGRSRNKADFNFGDCFAYACARSRSVPLLFKGNDFIHTDIEAA